MDFFAEIMTKSIKYINEHDWQNPDSLREEEEISFDIGIVYTCDRENELSESVKEFVSDLDIDAAIVVFEECIEKGGGGGDLLPHLYDSLLFGIRFIIEAGAAALVGKQFEKIFTKENFKKIFKKRVFSKVSKKVGCELRYNGHVFKYLIPSYLTFEEAEHAFQMIAGHFRGVYDTEPNSVEAEYIYDRKEQKWLPF